MRIDTFRRAIRLLGLVLPMTVLASSVQGQALGVGVSTKTVNQKLAYVVLPAGEALASKKDNISFVSRVVPAEDLFCLGTGHADSTPGSPAVTTATLGV